MFYFQLKCFVLFDLTAEESGGQGYFLCNAHGREQINVLELVLAVREVLHFHQALVDEGIEAVVQAAHALAQLLSQFALGQVGVFLQDAQDPKKSVLLDLGLTACYWVSFKVVLKRVKMCFGQAT